MVIGMIGSNNVVRRFGRRLLAVCFIAGLILLAMPASLVRAAGDASFSLSPSSGSYTVGSTLTVSLSETSSSGDNTNAVQANLTYPQNLTYEGMTLTGPFTVCGQQSGGGGSVNIGCAASSAQAGTQPIARITFQVTSSGSAAVNMAAGSDIVSIGGTSVWNTALPSAAFTLNNVVTTTPAPVVRTHSAPVPAAPVPVTAAPIPAPVVALPKPKASLKVTVTDTHHQPLFHVKVSLDDHYSAYTDERGQAGFSDLSGGIHTLLVTDHGNKTVQERLMLTADLTKRVAVQLSSAGLPAAVLRLLAAIVVVLAACGVYCYITFFRKSPAELAGQNGPPPTIVVGSGLSG